MRRESAFPQEGSVFGGNDSCQMANTSLQSPWGGEQGQGGPGGSPSWVRLRGGQCLWVADSVMGSSSDLSFYCDYQAVFQCIHSPLVLIPNVAMA